MNEMLTLMLAWMAGGMLGTIFFGGLWWTVRKGVLSQRPVRWFIGSLLLRISITLTGFYFVGGGHSERLLASLFGFAIACFLVTRLTGSPVEHHNFTANEAGHAP